MRRWSLAAFWLPIVLLVSGVLVWNWTRTSFFYADDWLNFGQARQYQMGSELLKHGYFGHFAPGHRAIDWSLLNWFDTSWGVYLVYMLTFYVIAVVAFAIVLRELRVPPFAAAVGTGLFALSSVWVRVIQWDASAAHIVPATAATMVSLAAAVAWMNRPRRWLIALSAASMAFGVLFYEKPVLVVGYIILLRWIQLPQLRLKAILAAARRDAPLLGVLIGVAAVYSVVVVTGGYSNTGPSVSASVWGHFLWDSWTDGTITLLVGQGSPEYAPAIPLFLRILAQVVLVVAVVFSIRRARPAWRAWAFLLIVWGVNVALVGIGRLGGFGAGIGRDPRYYAEMGYLLPLAVALAFRRFGTTRNQTETAPDQLTPASPEVPEAENSFRVPGATKGIAIALVATVAFLASSVNSFARLDKYWQGKDSRAWVDNLRATAGAGRDGEGILSIIEGAVPFTVVAINEPPFNQRSLIVPFVLKGYNVFDGSGDQPQVIGPTGRVRPARLTRVAGGDVTVPATQAEVTQGDAAKAPGGLCVKTAPSVVEVPVRKTLLQGTYLRIAVDAPPGGDVRGFGMRVDRGKGLPSGFERFANVRPGQHAGGAIIDPGPVREIAISVPAGSCLASVELVSVS